MLAQPSRAVSFAVCKRKLWPERKACRQPIKTYLNTTIAAEASSSCFSLQQVTPGSDHEKQVAHFQILEAEVKAEIGDVRSEVNKLEADLAAERLHSPNSQRFEHLRKQLEGLYRYKHYLMGKELHLWRLRSGYLAGGHFEDGQRYHKIKLLIPCGDPAQPYVTQKYDSITREQLRQVVASMGGITVHPVAALPVDPAAFEEFELSALDSIQLEDNRQYVLLLPPSH